MSRYAYIGDSLNIKDKQIRTFVSGSDDYSVSSQATNMIVKNSAQEGQIVLCMVVVDLDNAEETGKRTLSMVNRGGDIYTLLHSLGMTPSDCVYINASYAGSHIFDRTSIVGVSCTPEIIARQLAKCGQKQTGFVLFADENGSLQCITVYDPRFESEVEFQFGEVCSYENPKMTDNEIIRSPKEAFQKEDLTDAWINTMAGIINEKYGSALIAYPVLSGVDPQK